jgi:hypothetical protein
MADLIKHPTKVEVLTKDGECHLHITLDLNINLNSLEVGVKAKPVDEDEEKVNFEIPKFDCSKKIKFGKKETI